MESIAAAKTSEMSFPLKQIKERTKILIFSPHSKVTYSVIL